MEYKRLADIKRLQFIVDTLKSHFSEGAKVLDVGCGNGVISRGVGAAGFRVFGIDVSSQAINKARELTTNDQVIFEVISAEELVATGKKYEAVICSEVLEHLDHPEKLLQTLHESLTDDGILIVTVPNGKGPREMLVTRPMIKLQKKDNLLLRIINRIKRSLGYKGTTVQSDAGDLTHVQFFSKKSLYRLAAENQFSIISFGVTNFADDVFPFSLVTRKSMALQKVDHAVANRLPHRFAGSFVSVWKKALA